MQSLKRSAPARRALAVATLAAVLGIPCAAHAQTEAERIRDLEKKLDQSMKLIESLEKRVRDLEGSKAAATTATAAPAPVATGATTKPAASMSQAQEERLKAVEQSVAQMYTTGHDGHAGMGGLPLHGFADVEYHYTTLDVPDNRRSGFVVSNLDLFMTPEFGRVKMLAELNFEVESDSGQLSTDMERLQLGYTFSDNFTAWMGRFHTPYGYWNTAFHHGTQIQTATRPRFVDFEDKGGILPAHTVGLWGVGHVKAGDGRFQYDAWLGNGSRIMDGVLDFNAYRDDNRNTAVGGNVGYRFGGAAEGLLVGLHGFREEVDVDADDGAKLARTRLGVVGGYFYLDRDNWEGIGEYYHFSNVDLSGGTGTHKSWAAFLQMGYTLNDIWTPYYRWEKAALDQTDPYFAYQESGRAYTRNVVGIRYLLNPATALQLEGNRTREGFMSGEQSYTEVRAQFAVRF
jgi:hypothetical protein